ncbi:MAG: 16S rRNA (cytidine(1402)-2'-O)-methyltransferase [Eubacterium sp.]|nr:16S rRNA (cytidine(1402)-2'-O)-methyltransferase [Eubacterium sp.]
MLYLCATPIGNLGDMTGRVIDTLKDVDLIAAEDTRQTIKLLNHFDIKKPMVAYHEHNRYEMTPVLVERLVAGESIALVTDAGTPAISDPGEDLVRACHEAGVRVTSLPGATAFTTALTLSGLSARRFTFEGFLPQDKKEREYVLNRLRSTSITTVFYEAPHRLVKTLKILKGALDTDMDDAAKKDGEGIDLRTSPRSVVVTKELTKKHEWYKHFSDVNEAIRFFEETEAPRGEFVIVIEGLDTKEIESNEQKRWQEMTIEEHMEIYLSDGIEKKEAMRRVAKDRGVSKRDVYRELLDQGNTDHI